MDRISRHPLDGWRGLRLKEREHGSKGKNVPGCLILKSEGGGIRQRNKDPVIDLI